MKPIIGVTSAWSEETWTRTTENQGYYYVGKPYVRAINENGGIPLLISPEYYDDDIDNTVEEILEKVDGIIFSGGGDSKFTLHQLPTLRLQQPKRYYFEKKLMLGAWEKNIPVLGICRGHQMMAEVFGGSLAKYTVGGHRYDTPGHISSHDSIVEKNSYVYKIINEEEWKINSFHIQVIDTVPEGFQVCIHSTDGVIEGIEAVNKSFFIGLQFHPEELLPNDVNSQLIFQTFIQKANKR